MRTVRSLVSALFTLAAIGLIPASAAAVDIAPAAVVNQNVAPLEGPYPPPAAFLLPNGNFADAMYIDVAHTNIYFLDSNNDGSRITVPGQPVQSWAWTSVAGWTELICRTAAPGNLIVGINPKVAFFPMNGRTYNNGNAALTIEPRIRSNLGGTVKTCTFQAAGVGRVILAGAEHSSPVPNDGAFFTPVNGAPVAAAPQPIRDPMPESVPQYRNVNVETGSVVPSGAPRTLAFMGFAVLGLGAVALTRQRRGRIEPQLD